MRSNPALSALCWERRSPSAHPAAAEARTAARPTLARLEPPQSSAVGGATSKPLPPSPRFGSPPKSRCPSRETVVRSGFVGIRRRNFALSPDHSRLSDSSVPVSPRIDASTRRTRSCDVECPQSQLENLLEVSCTIISKHPTPSVGRLHPDRAAGRDRHHRRPDRPAAAGRAGGPRGRPPRPVHQQPEANRPGDAQLPLGEQLLPAGRHERQHPRRARSPRGGVAGAPSR